MQPLVFVRPLTAEEKQALEAGLRSRHAFTLRRSQILLASSRRLPPPQIAEVVGCTPVAVRKVIHDFQSRGLSCLRERPRNPGNIVVGIDASKREELLALLHQSPRTFGKHTSLWTLDLIAEVCFERGLTARRLCTEGIRLTLCRMQINWKRAKNWMTSPDPNYAAKKARRDRLIRLAAQHLDWVLGFEDEVWWSRLARPAFNAWTDGPPMKVQLLKSDANDPDPDAIACYGFLRSDTHKVMVRFVEDRPLAGITTQFLGWLCRRFEDEGKKVFIAVWDDASWHTAEEVALWAQEHNRKAKQHGGIKVVICELPVASPWLNNIEPCWKHAKKAIVEPDRKLTAEETTVRVCEHFGCELLPYLQAQDTPAGSDPAPRLSVP
jgi:transposase